MSKRTKQAEGGVESDTTEINETENQLSRPGRKWNWKKWADFKNYSKKQLAIAAAVLLLVLALAIPLTRYPILGLAVKKDASIKLIDAKSGSPVSEAQVSLEGRTQKTDSKGVAVIHGVSVGSAKATVTKKYYQAATIDVFVGLGSSKQVEAKVTPLGRPVKVRVTDKISGKPVAKAAVTFGSEKFLTGESGVAVVILPSSASEAEVTVSADSYNDSKAKITASESKEVDAKNSLAIVPSGKIYFLSKLSGRIDVVKTNLDGSDRQTVLAGTGNEDEYNTVLLASRDWKYLLLQAKRDIRKDYNALYIIDTQNNDKLITADEGNAYFRLAGWNGHDFVYTVIRNSINYWKPKRQAIKVYHADNGQLATLDESGAEANNTDSVYEEFGSVILLTDQVLYTHSWSRYHDPSIGIYMYNIGPLPGKQAGITTIGFNGSNKKDLKTLPPLTSFYSVLLYKPEAIYFSFSANSQEYYVELEDGTLKDLSKEEGEEKLNKSYPTYLLSPSGKMTFWSEERDGKDLFIVGDADGEDGKEIARLDEHNTYGWYTDNYVLLSKKGSELYIMGRSGGTPLKITDYHRPSYSYRGYGGGYGGL